MPYLLTSSPFLSFSVYITSYKFFHFSTLLSPIIPSLPSPFIHSIFIHSSTILLSSPAISFTSCLHHFLTLLSLLASPFTRSFPLPLSIPYSFTTSLPSLAVSSLRTFITLRHRPPRVSIRGWISSCPFPYFSLGSCDWGAFGRTVSGGRRGGVS